MSRHTVPLMVESPPSSALVIPTGVRTRRWPRAQQCSVTKGDGARCRRRALRGGRVCYVHGGQLPSVRAAAEAEVAELRARALSIADRALDVVEDALEHPDPHVRLRASAQLLDRVMPRQQAGVSVTVGITDTAQLASPAELIRERLDRLRDAQRRPEPSTEPEVLPGTASPWKATWSTARRGWTTLPSRRMARPGCDQVSPSSARIRPSS